MNILGHEERPNESAFAPEEFYPVALMGFGFHLPRHFWGSASTSRNFFLASGLKALGSLSVVHPDDFDKVVNLLAFKGCLVHHHRLKRRLHSHFKALGDLIKYLHFTTCSTNSTRFVVSISQARSRTAPDSSEI